MWGADLKLPNVITSGRLLAAPIVTILLLQPRPTPRLLAFVLFVLAALSDLWDGYLARSRGQVTTFGKMADPVADKFLLVSALIPVYMINTQQLEQEALPIFGVIPLWGVIVLLGREVLITFLRLVAARSGQIVAAREIGKRKAVVQNVFTGAAILWVTFLTPGFKPPDVSIWQWFSGFHGWFVTVFLMAALILTVVSAVLYVSTFLRIFTGRNP
ncbi:MAG: CDP-diacylglycerol--glycerol-3-phosphate 3-phosphatidyltransferase [SAR202 cluster bacterium]|nr:CDP-diacylglycerol--glycerol-3-phosphate 3-phosphatidyltransferase [SAR202 cluster bacterium]